MNVSSSAAGLGAGGAAGAAAAGGGGGLGSGRRGGRSRRGRGGGLGGGGGGRRGRGRGGGLRLRAGGRAPARGGRARGQSTSLFSCGVDIRTTARGETAGLVFAGDEWRRSRSERDVISRLAVVGAAILTALALFHVVLAFGNRRGARAVVPTREEGARVISPARTALGIAGFLLFAAFILIEGAGLGPGLIPPARRWGWTLFITSMFLLYGVFVLRGEIFPPLGSLRWMPGTGSRASTRGSMRRSRLRWPCWRARSRLARPAATPARARRRRGRPRPTWAACSRAIDAAIAADFHGQAAIDDPFAGAVRGAEALDAIRRRPPRLAHRARRAADARPGHARRRAHGGRGGAAAAPRWPRHRSPDRRRRRGGRAHRPRCARCASITASGRWKASTASGRRCCRAIRSAQVDRRRRRLSARARRRRRRRHRRDLRSGRLFSRAVGRALTSTAATPSCASS